MPTANDLPPLVHSLSPTRIFCGWRGLFTTRASGAKRSSSKGMETISTQLDITRRQPLSRTLSEEIPRSWSIVANFLFVVEPRRLLCLPNSPNPDSMDHRFDQRTRSQVAALKRKVKKKVNGKESRFQEKLSLTAGNSMLYCKVKLVNCDVSEHLQQFT